MFIVYNYVVSHRWNASQRNDEGSLTERLQVYTCMYIGHESHYYDQCGCGLHLCSVIMLDEAHERTLHTDIIVGLLRKVRGHAVTSEMRTPL